MRNLFKAVEIYTVFGVSKEAEELSDSENDDFMSAAGIVDPKKCMEPYRETFE